MPNSDKQLMWVAHDFSDGDQVLEKLCIKLKSAEEATKFKEAFEAAQ